MCRKARPRGLSSRSWMVAIWSCLARSISFRGQVGEVSMSSKSGSRSPANQDGYLALKAKVSRPAVAAALAALSER